MCSDSEVSDNISEEYLGYEQRNTTKTNKRKGVTNKESYIQNVRKAKRNSGEKYVTKTGRTVDGKIHKNKDCFCSRKCKNVVTPEVRKECFDSFWQMKDFKKQNAYISGIVQKHKIKRR